MSDTVRAIDEHVPGALLLRLFIHAQHLYSKRKYTPTALSGRNKKVLWQSLHHTKRVSKTKIISHKNSKGVLGQDSSEYHSQ